MKNILVLHTGGTIAMSEDQTTGKVAPNSENPLLTQGHLFEKEAHLIVEDIFQRPSPHMTPTEMLQLKNRIEQAVLSEAIDGKFILSAAGNSKGFEVFNEANNGLSNNSSSMAISACCLICSTNGASLISIPPVSIKLNSWPNHSLFV